MQHHLHQLILNKFVGQITLPPNINSPTCFIAYAWGNPEHEIFVQQQLAKDLQKAPVTVLLDVKDNSQPSSSISGFYHQILKCDFTLIVATPTYKLKAALGSNTVVRQEYELMLGVYQNTPEKIIRWLRAGTAAESFPPGLGSHDRVYGNVTTDDRYYREFPALLKNLFSHIFTSSPEFKTSFERLRAEYLEGLSTIEADDSPELEVLKVKLDQHATSQQDKKKRRIIKEITSFAQTHLNTGASDDENNGTAAAAPIPDKTEKIITQIIAISLIPVPHEESFLNRLLDYKQSVLLLNQDSRATAIQLLQQSHRQFIEKGLPLRSLYCLDAAYELQTTLNPENSSLTNTINDFLQKLQQTNPSLLLYIAQFNCINIARHLLHNRERWHIDIDATDIHNKTALMIATEHNSFEFCQLLLSYSAKIKKGHLSIGYTVLHIACKQGNEAIVDLFLSHPEKHSVINTPQSDSNGKNTPLHLAALNGHYAIVIKLLNENADPTARNAQNHTPLQEVLFTSIIADSKKQDEIACLLWEHSKLFFLNENNTETLSWILCYAAQKGLEAYVDKLLELNIMLPERSGQDNIIEFTFFNFSLYRYPDSELEAQWKEACIRILLKFISRMTIQKLEEPFTRFRGNILHAAAYYGYLSVVNALLARDVGSKCSNEEDRDDHRTALCVAAGGQTDDPEIARQLYEAFPESLQETSGFEKNTALHEACSEGNIRVVRFLLNQIPQEQRAEFINRPNKLKSTALHKVVEHNTYAINRKLHAYKKIVQLLIDEGANLSLRNRDNKTAETLAEEHALEDLLDLITTTRALPPAPAALISLQA